MQDALDAEFEFVDKELPVNPAYCVLNLCRIIYSWTTRDVVISKPAAADWFINTGSGEWRPLIEAARAGYGKGNRPADQEALLTEGTPRFFHYGRDRISELRA